MENAVDKEKKSFKAWIKEHKTELIIVGLSIPTLFAVIVGIKNPEAIEEIWTALKNLIEKTPKSMDLCEICEPLEQLVEDDSSAEEVIKNERASHDVSEHIRNLPPGWSASSEKTETAANHGYNLEPGQTWVESYTTGNKSA